MKWIRWFGRWAERDQALARLAAARQSYGDAGERVIQLSARTDLARKSAGSTQRAFDYVERTFATVTQEYARVGELIERLEGELERGRVGDFDSLEKALKNLGPQLDELKRQLDSWETTWQQIPDRLSEVEHDLAEVRLRVENAAAAVGAPLPLTEKLASMHQHLERIRRTLADGNPVEAGHLIDDLRIALKRVENEADLFATGAGALTQVEKEVAAARDLLTGHSTPPAEATQALTEVETLLAGLRPSLAAGDLEQFQHDLLIIRKRLSTVRSAVR